MAKKSTHFVKEHGVTIIIASIPLLIVIFLFTLYIFNERFQEVKEENMALQQQVAQLEYENGIYKKAYELLLADVEQLSEMFGAKDRYRTIAAEVNENINNETIEDTSFQDYVATGIIKHTCTPIHNTTEEFTLNLNATTPLPEQTIDFYLDAKKVDTIPLEAILNITAPAGVHELTFLTKTGSIEITNISINDVAVEGVVDLGTAWTVFDCQNTVSGRLISEPGAFRVVIQTQ